MNPVLFPLGHTGLFGAYLAWHLGGLARTIPRAIGALGWGLFAYELVGVYISFMFLAGPPRILAVGIAVCTGCASWLTTNPPPKPEQMNQQLG